MFPESCQQALLWTPEEVLTSARLCVCVWGGRVEGDGGRGGDGEEGGTGRERKSSELRQVKCDMLVVVQQDGYWSGDTGSVRKPSRRSDEWQWTCRTCKNAELHGR